MNIINPNYAVRASKNIFNIRKLEYQQLEETVKRMLIPAEEAGLTISKFGIKDVKVIGGELNKSNLKNLVIKLKKGDNEVDLSMLIPNLVDNNYVVIGGRRKIPLFQLSDLPIITRGDNIKLRTNIATFMIEEKKHFPTIHLSAFGKSSPLALIILAKYGIEEVEKRFSLDEFVHIDSPETLFDQLLNELKDFYEESKDFSKDDFVRELGRIIGKNYDAKTKGEDFLYSLDIIPRIDLMSSEFFHTDSIIDELIYAMQNGVNKFDDTDYRNKRIRCFEYVILAPVAKSIFDLCLLNRNTKNIKFKVNSKQILSSCNVSDIIQFDFAINPIEDLTKLSRVSILGPGGFKRYNVPKYLRDLNDSMFGRLCPVDTPDRENCGVLENLLVNTNLDDNLRFGEEKSTKQPISIPVSFVPFCEHDDQTRLQMASSQMRQAIMLVDFDKPLVQSGCESLYTDQTQFVRRARKNGEVVFIDNHRIIIIYDDKDFDIFETGMRDVYVENIDICTLRVSIGDKVKRGDIITESNFCNNGNVNIGRNLLTGIMIYHGHNYEDGIVISDKLSNKLRSVHYMNLSFTIPPDRVLLSLKKDKYEPLLFPPIQNVMQVSGNPNNIDFKEIKPKFSMVKKNTPYAIMKKIPTDPLEFYSIFEEESKLTPERDALIYDIKLYINKYNDAIPTYTDWVENVRESQKSKQKEYLSILNNHLPKDVVNRYVKENNLDKFSSDGNYKIKGDLINGIYVDIKAMFFRPIKVGDKIGNRHGNKGVISKIIPHDKMPVLPDGRHLEICISPLGIISRMNIGQIFELHLANSLVSLKKSVLEMLNAKESHDNIKKFILDYIKIIDNTEDSWYSKQFEDQFPTKIDSYFIENLSVIQPPFESCSKEMIRDVMEYTNTPFTYEVFDPKLNDYIMQKIAVGYMYFFRMVHIAESKISFRGIASYSRKTLQPLGGRKNMGGQRMGEMETACLISHDALENLDEFMTTKSDSLNLKNQYIKSQIDSSKEMIIGEDREPESVRLFQSYLTVLGMNTMKDNSEENLKEE